MVDNIELLNAKMRVEEILLSNTGSYSGVGVHLSDDTVTVYLRDTTEQAKKKAYDLLGSRKADGHEITFIHSGNIVALQCPTSHTVYSRPLCGGSSIGSGLVGAGTLATVCYDKNTKEKRLLSNNHVLSNSSSVQNQNAHAGDIIYAPGCLDSNGCMYIIGRLDRYVPMDEQATNFVDCAIAIPDNINDVSDEIIGIGKLNGYKEPTENLSVRKSGRTTGITSGTINDIFASIEVDYGGRIIKFTNCIVTSNMASAGDSGSCLIDDNNNAVGLLFAGSDTLTVHNRITYVMDQLGILMTTSDVSPTPQYITYTPYNYEAQSLLLASLGVGMAVVLFPIIGKQVQSAFHI